MVSQWTSFFFLEQQQLSKPRFVISSTQPAPLRRTSHKQLALSTSDLQYFPPAIRPEFVFIFLWQKLRLLELSTCPYCRLQSGLIKSPRAFRRTVLPCAPLSTSPPCCTTPGGAVPLVCAIIMGFSRVSPELCNTVILRSHQSDLLLSCPKRPSALGFPWPRH